MSFKEHPPQLDSSSDSSEQDLLHVPVLLQATLDSLKPADGENYLDLTAGYGGHARRFLEATKNYSDSVLVDRDDYAIERLSYLSDKGVRLLHTDFVGAAQALVEEGKKFNMI